MAIPYGSWKTPITSELIVSATINFHQISADGTDIYWIEWRPGEGGRHCLVKHSQDGRTQDVTPPAFNCRTTVHEYGGGAFCVNDGTVYFSNFQDQHLYSQAPGGQPHLLTDAAGMRFADAVVDRRHNRLICICEDHTNASSEPANSIVSVALDGSGEIAVLASGNDFYATPRLAPAGDKLAFLTWHHPNMPWDGCELWVADLDDEGNLTTKSLVAGSGTESLFQPEWSPDGQLYFISDRTGWWNLYRLSQGDVEEMCPMDAEFGRPQWAFGYSTYAFLSAQSIICTYTRQGSWQLASLHTGTKKLTPIECPYTDIMWLKVCGDRAVFRGGSPTEPASIVTMDQSRQFHVVRQATTLAVDPGYLSYPEPIEFLTADGLTAFALYYPAKNKDFKGEQGEKPPLLVKSHGGPTGATSSTLNLEIQFWTSRGISVLDVNYGGSTGYGRPYRERLKGRWGVVDVQDCIAGARYLAERELVDRDRLMITGGSAGGYTTLCALTFADCFACGASHYGIGDLAAMAADTHKFESRYLDKLIGPYPQSAQLYRERSPVHHVEKLSCPVIFFQGLEDKVVPPNQAEAMFAALRARGIPVAYVPFAGEQHGFRRAESVRRALDGELYFYSRVLGFPLPEHIVPVEIHNLPDKLASRP